MQHVNIHQAKTHLSRLLQRVGEGEEVVIARNGQPVAKIVPFHGEARKPGRLSGRIWMSDDFDDPLPDNLMAAFRGDVETSDSDG